MSNFLGVIIAIFCIVLLLITIVVGEKIAIKAEKYNRNINLLLISTKDYIVELFSGKNYFGIIMSIIIFVISIPGILIVLVAQICIYIKCIVENVYELGNK